MSDSVKCATTAIVSTLFVFVAMLAHGGAADNPDPEQWLSEAEAAYSEVSTYTAIFHKQQRVGGKLLPEETISLKYKKPSSLYMKWIREPYEGSELLYEASRNEDRVEAHRGGILRFVTRNLDPWDSALMAGNLRPVTSTGIGYLLETVAMSMRKAMKAGALTFTDRGEEAVYGRNTRVLEIVIPKKIAKDYAGCRFVINQDVESKILVRIRVYDCDGQLVENYGYEKLDLNAPLVDADFDPRNPEYHF